MPDTSTLTALRARVLAATGPDRGLDEDIAMATLWLNAQYRNTTPISLARNERGRFVWEYIKDGERARVEYDLDPVAHYTGSIAAAAALVERMLPGAYRTSGYWSKSVEGKRGQCLLSLTGGQVGPVFAATEPLAILAALLSVLIDREGE